MEPETELKILIENLVPGCEQRLDAFRLIDKIVQTREDAKAMAGRAGMREISLMQQLKERA